MRLAPFEAAFYPKVWGDCKRCWGRRYQTFTQICEIIPPNDWKPADATSLGHAFSHQDAI